MFVTAQVLAHEIGVTPKTILEHVRRFEKQGHHLRATIGKPAQINRERFLYLVYGDGWREKEGNNGE